MNVTLEALKTAANALRQAAALAEMTAETCRHKANVDNREWYIGLANDWQARADSWYRILDQIECAK